jgi:hypothetical protein
MIHKLSFFFIFSLLLTTAHAGLAPGAYVEGIVNNFDENYVTLISGGRKMKVPRSAFGKDQVIKGGNKVIAIFDSKDIQKKLIEAKNAKSKK